jgi:phosphate uptake regulator
VNGSDDGETRKIQEVGGGTYTVSLPKGWTRSEGLEAGETVTIHTHSDGLLVVQARERESETRRRIAVSTEEDDAAERVERLIRSAYAAGVLEVELDPEGTLSETDRDAIDRVTRTLPGATIASESADRAVVRTVLDAEEVSIHQSLRQLLFVASSMHRDAVAGATDPAAPELESARDDQADRLFALVDRHVTRAFDRLETADALCTPRPDLFELWMTARELERVADHAVDIAGEPDPEDGPMDPDLAERLRTFGRRSRDVVEDATSVMIGDADLSSARRALAARDRLREEFSTFERTLFESDAAGFRTVRVLRCLSRTIEHGGNVAEIAVRSAIRRDEYADPPSDASRRDRRESSAASER